MNTTPCSDPFRSSNPLYKIATRQNFAKEEFTFGPSLEVLEMLLRKVSLGNFSFSVVDFRTYTFPYHSPNSIEVTGYSPEEMPNLEWVTTVIHPDHLPLFNAYTEKGMRFATQLSAERKKRSVISHCFKCLHGKRKEYFWLYQQLPLSGIDQNGALLYSITLMSDVTHLHGHDDQPTWSIIERMDDGSYKYLIGSEIRGAVAPVIAFTSRELEVLDLSAMGFNAREIAGRLNVSYETIVTHRKNIIRKSKSKNISEAVASALNAGYL
jgi:DNA-binding CsgD family transcriptional regulator